MSLSPFPKNGLTSNFSEIDLGTCWQTPVKSCVSESGKSFTEYCVSKSEEEKENFFSWIIISKCLNRCLLIFAKWFARRSSLMVKSIFADHAAVICMKFLSRHFCYSRGSAGEPRLLFRPSTSIIYIAPEPEAIDSVSYSFISFFVWHLGRVPGFELRYFLTSPSDRKLFVLELLTHVASFTHTLTLTTAISSAKHSVRYFVRLPFIFHSIFLRRVTCWYLEFKRVDQSRISVILPKYIFSIRYDTIRSMGIK